MVLEALAAIGLAANVIQFASFSSTLISGTYQAYHSASGLPEEYVDLDRICSSIVELRDKITQSAANEPKVKELVDHSVGIAQELLDATKQLRPQHGGAERKRWSNFRKALKSVWEKSHIVQLQSRLQSLRDQLTVQLVWCTSDQQLRLNRLLEEWQNQNREQQTQAIRRLEGIQKALTGHHDESFWSDIRTLISEAFKKVKEVPKASSILQSLHYDSMEVRHASVVDAHQKTFEWIFHAETPPQSGPHSAVEYSSWLEAGDGIYWITGKPGSGKSTLMKFLDDHPTTQRHLACWAKGASLVKASFYFWNPGTEMQKSLLGLLQSLLFHVLVAHPDLIPILCAQKWKEQALTSVTIWSVKELRKSLTALKGLYSKRNTMFYFHIDGLDEYVGDSLEVIGVLEELSASPNIKLCVSSRPWNYFKDAFGRCGAQMLQLQELTASDIKLFARDTLSTYRGHQEYIDQGLFDNLLDDICERAQGVFLWVRLVVRSLRDGFANDDPLPLLKRRLHALPTDLEGFFEHIINSVDNIYQEQMARTFLAALLATEPMNIMHYSFLEEENDPSGLELQFEPFGNNEIESRILRTQRRLNGRYKGLLEPSDTPLLPDTPVDFLHRSLRDFLETGRIRTMLESCASGHLDVFSDITRVHLAATKYTTHPLSPRNFRSVIQEASSLAKRTGSILHEFDALDHVDLICSQYVTAYPKQLMETLATIIGRVDYLEYRLKKDGAKIDLDCLLLISMFQPIRNTTFGHALATRGPALVAHALTTNSSNAPACDVDELYYHVSYAVEPNVVCFLLRNGANPYITYNGKLVWCILAQTIFDNIHLGTEPIFKKVFGAFLRHGADVMKPIDFWAGILKYRTYDDQLAQNKLELFRQLFSNGLRPHAQSKDMSLWDIYLRTLSHGVCSPVEYQLLKEFLLHGANVCGIYSTSPKSWLTAFLQRLKGCQDSNILESQVVILDILLAHCLDLTHICAPGITMWKRILDTIFDSLSSRPTIELPYEYLKNFCIILTNCLRYRADPHCTSLDSVLDWLNSHESLIQQDLLQELNKVVQSEREDKKLQGLVRQPIYGTKAATIHNRNSYPEHSGPGMVKSAGTVALSVKNGERRHRMNGRSVRMSARAQATKSANIPTREVEWLTKTVGNLAMKT